MGNFFFHQAADQLAFIDNRHQIEAALGEFGNNLRALIVGFDAKQTAIHQVANRLAYLCLLQKFFD